MNIKQYNEIHCSGSSGEHGGWLLENDLGAEGEGGGDDHQPGGAGEAEVRAVLARGWIYCAWDAGGGGA